MYFYFLLEDAGMKTLIALDDQEELIDKFESAADGINQDMALAEKALKVGGPPPCTLINLGATRDIRHARRAKLRRKEPNFLFCTPFH